MKNPLDLFNRHLLLLDKDEGGGGGGGDDKDKGEDKDKKPGEETPPDDKKDKGEEKKFSEGELNSAAANARKTANQKLFDKYGVKDEAELEKKLKALAEIEDKDKSELEKLQKAADDAATAREKAETAAKTATETANVRLKKADVMVALAQGEHGVHSTAFEDVWTLIQANPEALALIEIAEETGIVSGSAKAIEKVIKGRDYLLSKNLKQPIGNNTGKDKTKPESKDKKSDDPKDDAEPTRELKVKM